MPNGVLDGELDPASSRITVQPSQPMPRLAELPLVALSPADRMRIPVGVAAGGQIIYWEPASSPHMLLVGPTGPERRSSSTP